MQAPLLAFIQELIDNEAQGAQRHSQQHRRYLVTCRAAATGRPGRFVRPGHANDEDEKEPERVARSGGAIMLAAPGTGKTTWVVRNPAWHDADLWAPAMNLHKEEWHETLHTQKVQADHYLKVDSGLRAAREQGNRIVGSLFWEVVPDAIVLIEEEEHKRRVAQRPELVWSNVQSVVRALRDLAQKHEVPIFASFDEAAAFVAVVRRGEPSPHVEHNMHPDFARSKRTREVDYL